MEDGHEKIMAASLLVMVGTALAAVTEFGRDAVVAALFGATENADAFFGALVVPALLLGIFVYAGKTVLVPVFTDILTRHPGKIGMRRVDGIVFLAVSTVFIVCVIGILLSGPVTAFTLPKLSPDALRLAARLQRIFYIFLLGSGSAVAFSSFLYSIRRFTVPAFMQAVMNIVLVAVMLLTASRGGVDAAAKAFVAGAVVQLLMVVVVSVVQGLRPVHPGGKIPGESGSLSFLLLMPVFLMGVRSLNQVVDRAVASYLEAGSISAINYASRIVFGIRAVIAGSIFTASIPFLSTLLTRGDGRRVKLLVESGIKGNLLVMLPVSLFIMLNGERIVSLLYERGAFMPQDSARTAAALFWFALGLLPSGLILVTVSPFFADRKPMVPILNALAMFVLNAVLTIWLALGLHQGLKGIAAASSLTFMVSAMVVTFLLKRWLGRLLRPGFFLFAFRVVFAAALSGWIGQSVCVILDKTVGSAVSLPGGGIAFSVVYILALKVMKTPELDKLIDDAVQMISAVTRIAGTVVTKTGHNR